VEIGDTLEAGLQIPSSRASIASRRERRRRMREREKERFVFNKENEKKKKKKNFLKIKMPSGCKKWV